MAEDESVIEDAAEPIVVIGPHDNDPDEDPEQHVREETPDPWDDPDQEDWPNETVEID